MQKQITYGIIFSCLGIALGFAIGLAIFYQLPYERGLFLSVGVPTNRNLISSLASLIGATI